MKHFISDKIRQNFKYVLLFGALALFYFSFGCPIRLFSGVSCPSCGMSRAVAAAFRLDFSLAAEMHPLVFLLPVAVLVYLLRKRISKRLMTGLCACALILLLITYLIRMSTPDSIVYADFESGLLYKMLHAILN